MATHTIPPGAKVSYRQQHRRCGKPTCPTCANGGPGHGPYWYAFWWADGRVRSQYVGKTLPEPATEPARDRGALDDAGPDTLWVRTLGGFAVWRGPAIAGDSRLPADGWARRKKAAALFRHLLSAPQQRVSREALMDALWPDAEPETASSNLRYTVHLLRKILDRPEAGRSHLRVEGDILLLAPGAEADPPADWLDAAAFEGAAASALAGHDADRCRAALALYTGAYLPDAHYEDWVLARRRELQARYLSLLQHLAALCIERGDHDEARRHLGHILAEDPCQEAAARDLLRLQALAGHRTEAIRTYRLLAEALSRDLGVAPDRETHAIYRRLLDGGLGAAPVPLAPATGPLEPVQPDIEALGGAAGETTLSGRQRELAMLSAAFERARAGQGGLILLGGGAGMGKSRIQAEFLRDVRSRDGLILAGRAYQAEGQLPYGPLQDALRTFLTAQPTALLREQAAFHAILAPLIPDLARLIPDLPAPTPLEPRAERHRVFAAIAGLMRDLAGRRPVVLAIDDLHWADRTTLEALHYLARTCADTRLLIVGAYRAEDLAAEGAQAEMLAAMRLIGTTLDLRPLDNGETAALVRTLLAPERVGEDVRNLVAGQARGNPLFVHLMVTALRESGRAAVANGRWQLAATTGEAADPTQAQGAPAPWRASRVPMPSSIHALILERAARLSPDAGRVLRLCAVLGHHLIYEVLPRAADLDEEPLLDALDDLLAADLLEETPPSAAADATVRPGYAFRHPLIQEAIYQQIPDRRRQLLHRRAGDALEALLGGASAAYAADLAWHFDQAARHESALRYAEIAGDRAAASHAAPEAVAHYMRAVAHLEAMAADAGSADGAHRADALARLHGKLGDLRTHLGHYAAAEEHFRLALMHAADPVRRAELLGKAGDTWQKRGEFNRALEAIAAAEEECGEGEGSPAHTARAALLLLRGQIHYHQGRYTVAAETASRVLDLLGAMRAGPVAARAHLLIANACTQQSDFARAEAAFRHSLAIWEGEPDGTNQDGIATVWNGLALIAHHRGDYALAEEQHRRSLAIRERIGHEWGVGASWNNLGNLAYDRGDFAEAAASYRRSLAIWERLGEQNGIGAAWNNLGDLALAEGDLAEAERCQERSLGVWQVIGNTAGVSVCRKNLGDIALARGALAHAEEHFRAAERLAEETGVQEFLSGAWIGLGTVALERGEPETALGRYRAARRIGRCTEDPGIQARAALRGGWAYLRAGRLRGARAMHAHAHGRIAAYGLTHSELDADLLLAEMSLAEGSHAATRAVAARALHLAIQNRARREEAQARSILGRCAAATHDLADAREHIEAALAIQVAGECHLDAARSRLTLARHLRTAGAGQRAAALALAEEARAGFAAAGAALDCAQADRLLSEWRRSSADA